MFQRISYGLAAAIAIAALIAPISANADNKKNRGGARLHEQLTQFNGGCPPNALDDPDGCIDVQFSVHRAPVCSNGPNANVGGYSLSMVRSFDDGNPLKGGSSTLVRAGDGVAFTLTTTGLRPNAPYTLWFVGFNPGNPCIETRPGPGKCDCGEADIDAVFWAAGAMTDRLGSATFIGHTNYDSLPDGSGQVPFPDLFPEALSAGAEIHFVARAHGKALKGNGGRGRDDD